MGVVHEVYLFCERVRYAGEHELCVTCYVTYYATRNALVNRGWLQFWCGSVKRKVAGCECTSEAEQQVRRATAAWAYFLRVFIYVPQNTLSAQAQGEYKQIYQTP